MHSAATVVATSDAVCWALDRVSFRRVLLNTTLSKRYATAQHAGQGRAAHPHRLSPLHRRTYEAFLEEVPLLAGLEPYERIKIADALESVAYPDGAVIIKQGYECARARASKASRPGLTPTAGGLVQHGRDRGTTFFIIEEGEVRVSQVDAAGASRELPPLKKGQYFGGT